jgi:hypothetical protein
MLATASLDGARSERPRVLHCRILSAMASIRFLGAAGTVTGSRHLRHGPAGAVALA